MVMRVDGNQSQRPATEDAENWNCKINLQDVQDEQDKTGASAVRQDARVHGFYPEHPVYPVETLFSPCFLWLKVFRA
jgi:hypothetical protein